MPTPQLKQRNRRPLRLIYRGQECIGLLSQRRQTWPRRSGSPSTRGPTRCEPTRQQQSTTPEAHRHPRRGGWQIETENLMARQRSQSQTCDDARGSCVRSGLQPARVSSTAGAFSSPRRSSVDDAPSSNGRPNTASRQWRPSLRTLTAGTSAGRPFGTRSTASS